MNHDRVANRAASLNFFLPIAGLALVAGVGLLIFLDRHGSMPSVNAWLHLDAGWYNKVREVGYVYNPSEASNTAFFPLFPYLWRWMGLGPIGISVFNALLAWASCWLLFRYLPGGWRAKVAFLSTSLLTFYLSPFSESLFFFFTTLLLIGLKNRATALCVVGILGAGLTRFVGTIFVPAFLLIALDTVLAGGKKEAVRRFLVCAAVSVIPALLVFWIQTYQTGHATAFFDTQRYWGTWWRMPNSPFSTWPPAENGLYDQLALFVCLLCIVASMVYAIRRLRQSQTSADPLLSFSILYCCGLSLLMLFTKGGVFNSINRYVFATPLLWPIFQWLERQRFRRPHLTVVIVLGVVYFTVFWHMAISLRRILWAVGLLSIAVALPLLITRRDKVSSWLIYAAALLFLYLQAHLYYRYLAGVWVG